MSPPSNDRPSAGPAPGPADLRDRPFFIALSDEQIGHLLEAVVPRSFRQNETIVSEGEAGGSLFVILDGLVEIRRGKRVVGAITGEDSMWAIEEGDFFGEMSLLDYQPRAATVVAATDVKLLEFPHDKILELWGADRDLQIVLLTNMARILSRRLRRMND